MKFALVNGQRREAEPGASGRCLSCDQEMVAKCGKVKVRHWAHKGRRTCDPWWENETDWHRAWKGQFPENWQEVVHKSESGERHIADVKTDQGWAIEFQHSHIKPEERESRDIFYKKLVWVIDGTRRPKDPEKFQTAINNGFAVGSKPGVRRVRSDSCPLLREWSVSDSPVFFDFGGGKILWWLAFGRHDGWSYIAPFSCAEFIEIHRGGATDKSREFSRFVADSRGLFENYEANLQAPRIKGDPLQAMLNSQRRMPRSRW